MALINQFVNLFYEGRRKSEAKDEIDYGSQPATVAQEMEFLTNFMTLNEKERMLIGHDFKSLIKSCTFRGKDCLDKA